MKILLVGGGTGGHITPPLSVAKELKSIDSQVEIDYVIDRGSKFIGLPKNDKNIAKTYQIFAGKLRRYHGESFLSHLVDVKTIFLNIIDVFKLAAGTLQSLFLVNKIKPNIVFIKGGFVGVPVGLACAFWRIPYVVHDSDALPGLANRVIGRWAKMHLVGMPVEYYSYPRSKTAFVGNPVSNNYKKVTKELKNGYRKKFGIGPSDMVLAITGGSLGAEKLNVGMRPIIEQMVKEIDNLYVLHQTGNQAVDDKQIYEKHNRIHEETFVSNLFEYTGAADVVIARGGAGTIAELAVQAVPTILVPNPRLTGGHQLINTKHLTDKGAVLELSEAELGNVKKSKKFIEDILRSKSEQASLSKAFALLAKPNSAKEIADHLLKIGK